ncbi:hypothetical protein CDAR_396991 [Caerostris darwini]|uniref:Uncharacterized protein n=1 Tax=Caerostris darwini TaxID=1538125 RepID=A0AAV4Q916_9ARAC|nr:hypothetical protein CDAR_396991 [Caerostris darwini]
MKEHPSNVPFCNNSYCSIAVIEYGNLPYLQQSNSKDVQEKLINKQTNNGHYYIASTLTKLFHKRSLFLKIDEEEVCSAMASLALINSSTRTGNTKCSPKAFHNRFLRLSSAVAKNMKRISISVMIFFPEVQFTFGLWDSHFNSLDFKVTLQQKIKKRYQV